MRSTTTSVIGPSVHLYTRVWRGQPIKRVYSVAVLGLAYGAASQMHRELLHAMGQAPITPAQFTDSASSTWAFSTGTIDVNTSPAVLTRVP